MEVGKYEASHGAIFESNVEARNSASIGSMTRKSLYTTELFPPLSLDSIKGILGDLFEKFEKTIREITIPYLGEYKVPVGLLSEVLGDAVSPEVHRSLFSNPQWVDESPNLVVMAGLTDSIDKHFKGSSYTAAWYVGLVSGTPTFAEGNTMASHAGWYEVAPYSGARPTLTLGTVVSGSVDNSAVKASYTVNASMVVGGAFLVTLPTAGQTSGTLYGGAAFTGGNRSVLSGDTLNVTVTLSATAS